jgi:BirA family biotin operon repressor/biotin-[acetyl-CoA-carboxylase] ligase
MGADNAFIMNHVHRLIQRMADGLFHSGEELGAMLGLTRSGVWKQLKTLEVLGLELFAVPGRGYRLARPLELLERDRIVAQLSNNARATLAELELFQEVDSTNRHLVRRGPSGLRSGSVCLAESQQAGRGRRGRAWVSPYGASLYLSVAWSFACAPRTLSGLSIACGIGVARALESMGIEGIGLKWPNDLLWRQRKLGGILIEIAGEASGPCLAVVGAGINMNMPKQVGAQIDQPWVDIASVADGVGRNALAAALIEQLFATLFQYETVGIEPFLSHWAPRDVAAGKYVELQLPDRMLSGIARGVDPHGALLLETAEGLQRFSSGEVSLRVIS